MKIKEIFRINPRQLGDGTSVERAIYFEGEDIPDDDSSKWLAYPPIYVNASGHEDSDRLANKIVKLLNASPECGNF